jgi:hypothetical protein
MTKLLSLFATLALVLACGLVSAAQTNSQESTTPAELSILIGQRQVKFTPLRQAQELRLEVFNNAGELLYDSGALTEAELNWNLLDSQGQPLAPGLYAYTLSLKTPEAEAPRQHQGHLIIEKGHDQIWLTTKGAGQLGVEVTGGELTVARNSESATAGAGYLASGRTLGERAGIQRAAEGRSVADDKATGAEMDSRLAPNISGSGTTNRVTKWQDGPNGVVGDSVISEVGGNVGIGTGSPAAGLDYRGSTAAFFTRDVGPANVMTAQSALQLGLSNAGSRFAGVGPSFLFFAENSAGAKSFLGRVSGVWENPTAGAELGGIFFQVRANSGDVSALTERMRISASGRVGINTTVPVGQLEVVGNLANDTLVTTSFGDDNTVIGRAAGGSQISPTPPPADRSLLLLSGSGYTAAGFTTSRAAINLVTSESWTNTANGSRINFFTTPNGSTSQSHRMRIDHDGRVGINTTAPGGQLEVVDNSGNGALFTTTFGDDNAVLGRAAAGTANAPTATPANRSLLYLGGRGHTGAEFTFSKAAVNLAASENWTSTANGARLSFETTANGSTHRVERMRIDHNGNVGIGTTMPNAKLEVISPSNTNLPYINSAIHGESTYNDGIGVAGIAHGSGSVGIEGVSYSAAYAGYFFGDVGISGNLTKTSGAFKIDHPLDPANKYLYHSFVESPDMKNIYDGTVTTDAVGEAEVVLPDWFEALNRDFRYQLTVLGQFAQVIVAEEIKDNRFKIRTSLPNVKVSWQVTGIRQDAYAERHRIPVEQVKLEKERGTYLHPAVFGQPEEKGVEWARRPELMKRLKEAREKQSAPPAAKPERDK